MKHVVLALFLLGLPPSLLAQSSCQNYVLTQTLLNASGSNKVTEVQYHDGLGRPEIHVTTGLGVSGNSAYTLTEYDELGRGHIHWLPGIGGKGVGWKTAEEIKGLSSRSNGDEDCYSEATYDPLGRERSVLGPGEAWKLAGKPQQTQRVANLLAGKPDLVVKRYVLGQDGQPEEMGAWKSGALMGERHVDEDGKSVTVFTNLMGEKVLERQVISAGVFADTYYVYDDLGQLRFVLPPMCDLGAGKQQALEAYAYEYRYDGRSRVVYKRLPGCAPVRYWYDNRGRVVFTQDGELLKRGLCRFTFYDPHGRLAMQGTCTDTPHNVHSGVVTLSSVDGLFHSGYVGGVHLASPKVERINYYDDYNFLDGPSFKEYTNVNLMRKKNAQNATGHPTGSVTLTTGGERLYGVTYYTAKGLPCDTRQSCLGGKLDRALFDGGFCLLSGQHTAYCYYVCDHLGSVREVVSEAWNVQRNGYYAYGGPYGDWNTNADVQPLKFLGKEWDHQHGLDLYDFGARLYDPAVGRWTTMDPLCEKYYSVSPYAYCFNNPVKFIDPDGKKVLIFYQDKRGNLTYFVFNGTQRRLPNNSFVLDFVHTYNYLKANGVGKNVIKAVKDPSVMVELVRDEQETGYYFNYKDRNPAVFWESRKGIILSNGKRQSPAVRLEHEFDHALDDIHDHKKHEDRRDTQNAQYDNEEERRVIEGSEAETARKLRQGVRFDHWGKTYPVKDPRFTK